MEPLAEDLRPVLVPAFCPPAIRIVAAATGASEPRLDLAVHSRPVVAQDKPAVITDLHLAGDPDNPQVTGSVSLRNQTLRLPSTRFLLPSATISYDGTEGRMEGTAFGMTRAGLGTLRLGGTVNHPAVLAGFPEVSVPSAVFSLLMGPLAAPASPVGQSPFWLRQETLFPLPPLAWAASPVDADAGSLGFYGAPWIWNISTAKNDPLTK